MTAYWPRIPSKPSTARWRRAANAPRACVLPIRASTRCGTPSSVPAARRRLSRSRPAPSSCGSVGPRSGRDLAGRHHLSAAPLAPARPDRTPAQQLPLSRHRIRLPGSPVLHAPLQPSPSPGLGRRTSTPPRRRRPAQARIRQNQHTGPSMDRSGPIRCLKLDTYSPCVLTQAGLEQHGVMFAALNEEIGSAFDPFDLICHVAYEQKPLTRKERAEQVKKRDYFTKYGDLARKVIAALLDKYADDGGLDFENPEIIRLDP